MIQKRSMTLFLFLSMLCLTAQANQTQLIADNFDFRGSVMSGDPLSGRKTQNAGSVYDYPARVSFQFSEINGEEVASPAPQAINSTTSFLIPITARSGKIKFVATVNFNKNKFNGLAGAWIGFSASSNEELLYGTKSKHLALRFMPTGRDAGRIQLRTRSGDKTNSSFSSESLEIFQHRDYQLSLEYDFHSHTVIATVIDPTTHKSISSSTTLAGAVELNKGQFDITALASEIPSVELPYFKNISISYTP